ncbi:MAG: SufE family protein [Anaerolineales bacterium]|nr:SufE family protein [Anaerolineales bacterium]
MSTDETLPPLPARLQNIVEDFALCEGKEKLELLLQFSEQLPPLPERLSAHKDQMEPVPECMSPVFAHAEVEAGRFQFFLDVPAEAPTVRGFAAILSLGLADATPQQILDVPLVFYQQMGLQTVLSGQRLNGMRAILARLKQYARQALAGQSGGPA